jgi:hypothetical protein
MSTGSSEALGSGSGSNFSDPDPDTGPVSNPTSISKNIFKINLSFVFLSCKCVVY